MGVCRASFSQISPLVGSHTDHKEQPAYAYIDPGLGSLLVQSLVAGFLAIGVAWAGFKMKIMSFFELRKAGPRQKNSLGD